LAVSLTWCTENDYCRVHILNFNADLHLCGALASCPRGGLAGLAGEELALDWHACPLLLADLHQNTGKSKYFICCLFSPACLNLQEEEFFLKTADPAMRLRNRIL
jgi:hypothetical protein